MRPVLRLPLAAAALLLVVGSLHAQGSPPLVTDDPGTPGPGRWEINLGVGVEHRPGETDADLPRIDLNYGVGERLQLKLEFPQVVRSARGEPRRSGLGDAEVGVKWRWRDADAGGPALSVYPQYAFKPPGSSAVARGLVDPGTALVLPVQLEQPLGDFTLNVQVGREFHPGEDAWLGGVALSRHLSPRWQLSAELAGEATARLRRGRLLANLGVVWTINDRYSLLAALGRELHNDDAPRATCVAYLGCQLRR